MKELSIEEKAKAYDEAIKRLEDIEAGKCQKTFVFTEGLFDYIFPEFKESGDERIRREITELVMKPTWKTEKEFYRRKELCAWLERQDDKYKIIKDMDNKDDERLRKTTISFLKDFADKGYENAVECIDWLEKAGMCKPAIFIPKFRVGDKLVSTKNPLLTYEVLEVGHINELGNQEYKMIIFDNENAKSPQDIHYLECKKVDEWAELIERKHADWSEEDEIAIDDAIWCCKQAASIAKDENDMGTAWYAERWLKSLKERIEE